MKKSLVILLAVLLFLCLAPMPYGYYKLVRFISMVGFAYLAYSYYALQKKELTWCFASLALLFQPFFPISLGRVIWNTVDVIVGIFLVILLFKDYKK
jgi:predicted membrane protein